MGFSDIQMFKFRVRLPSGRTGETAVLANNYTTAVEIADVLFPGRVLTIPTPVKEKTREEDTSIDG